MPSLEIIAHRGASRERPENSLAAFDLALEQGADGIELDVHATRDGVLVVHHDPHVHDASGTPGSDGMAIDRVDYATLSTLRLANGESTPTLDDVLARVAHRATVYVEVKGAGIESAVIECLARHPGTRSAVHAFDHRVARRIHERNGAVATGILSASYAVDTAHMLHAAGARDLWQHHTLIDEALVAVVHAAGGRVIAWTENDPAHARMLATLGVDAICTDVPGPLRAALATLPLRG